MTVFVSYSRREFHFAEAVTATLTAHGALAPWLDVQRLRPGTNWAEALDESLERADALLLLASPAAIASAYVRREWTRALERGIPVHVAVVEAVELPGELAGCPVHDLRTRFRQRAAALGEAIAESRTGPPATAVPRPNRLGLPGRLPAPVAATVALSVVAALALAGALVALVIVDVAAVRRAWNPFGGIAWMHEGSALDVLRTQRWQVAMFTMLGLTALAAPLLPGVLVPGLRLLRRRSTYVALLAGFGATAVAGLVVLAGARIITRGPELSDPEVTTEVFPTPPEVTAVAGPLTVLLGIAVGCAAAGAVLVLTSRTVHLWLPTGAGAGYQRGRNAGTRRAHQQLRVEWHAFRARGTAPRSPGTSPERPREHPPFLAAWQVHRARLAALPAPETPFAVEVRCLAPADEAVAEQLRAACREADLTNGPSPARWVLVLVSSQVSWAEARRVIGELGPRAICVLLDTVRLPPDTAELRRHQWLDFRERRPDSLFPLFAALRSPDTAAAEAALAPTPVTTSRFLAPLTARQFVAGCQNVAGALPGFAAVAVVFRPLEAQSTVLAVVTGLLVLCLLRMGGRVATREISAARFRRGSAVTFAVAVLWSGVAASVFWIPVTVSPVWGSYLPKDHEFVTIVLPLIAMVAGCPALIALGYAYCFPLLRAQWLPPTAGPPNARPPRFGGGTWRGFVPALVTPGIFLALLIEYHVAYAH